MGVQRLLGFPLAHQNEPAGIRQGRGEDVAPVALLMAGSCMTALQPTVGNGRARRRSVAVGTNCWDFRADGRNRSTVVGGTGPAARILNPSPNATNGATRATRREAGATGFDCGAGGAALPALLRCSGGSVTTE